MLIRTQYDLKLIEQYMSEGNWNTWYSPIVKRAPTYSEAFLTYLFNSLGFDFVREYVIDRYPVDFFFPESNLCVDVDSEGYRGKGGKSSKKKKGDVKEAYLRGLGYEFHRFKWVRVALTFNRHLTEERIDETLDKIEELKIRCK